MKRILIASAFVALAAPAWAGQAVTPQDMEDHAAQMKEAQQMMNSPEYKRQMQEAMNHMKRQGMDTRGMDQMPKFSGAAMEAAMGMSQCMQEKIGKDGMNRMAEQGRALDAKVKALCAAGKTAEAARAREDYARQAMNSAEYKAMQGCAERYKELARDPTVIAMKKRMGGAEKKDRKICG